MTLLVELYVREECIFCDKAIILYERYLREQGYDMEMYHLIGEQSKDAMVERIGCDVKTVPQVFVNGKYIGGYDDFYIWIVESTLKFEDLTF